MKRAKVSGMCLEVASSDPCVRVKSCRPPPCGGGGNRETPRHCIWTSSTLTRVSDACQRGRRFAALHPLKMITVSGHRLALTRVSDKPKYSVQYLPAKMIDHYWIKKAILLFRAIILYLSDHIQNAFEVFPFISPRSKVSFYREVLFHLKVLFRSF